MYAVQTRTFGRKPRIFFRDLLQVLKLTQKKILILNRRPQVDSDVDFQIACVHCRLLYVNSSSRAPPSKMSASRARITLLLCSFCDLFFVALTIEYIVLWGPHSQSLSLKNHLGSMQDILH